MFYSYRVHILRITNMKVSIFKMSDDKMDDVGGQTSEDEVQMTKMMTKKTLMSKVILKRMIFFN